MPNPPGGRRNRRARRPGALLAALVGFFGLVGLFGLVSPAGPPGLGPSNAYADPGPTATDTPAATDTPRARHTPGTASPGQTASNSPSTPPEFPRNCEQAAEAPSEGPLWQQQRLQFKRAWRFTKGENVTVAVVDTGVSAENVQLEGDGVVVGGTDFVGDNTHTPPWEVDCDGHGTFVAGIIAARGVSGTRFVGVAPRAHILSVRYAHDNEAPIARLAKGIRWAVDHDADIINVSSVAMTPYTKLREAVRYAKRNDVVVVAAAGNDRAQGNPVTYPAAFPGVIAVGAIDKEGQLTSGSETAVDVSVVAPGNQVVSTATKSGHVTDGGTSFAAPFVSGVAALVRSAHPELSAEQVKHRIEVTADHIGGDLPAKGYGWGVVDAYQAVTAIVPAERGATPTRPDAAPLPPVHLPPPPDHSTRDLALTIGAGGGGAVLLLLAGLVTIRRGRRRRWRPGSPS